MNAAIGIAVVVLIAGIVIYIKRTPKSKSSVTGSKGDIPKTKPKF